METRELPSFGNLVRRLRTTAALSQEELAERAGLSVRAISDLERGVHRAPRLETVRMVADALGLKEAERTDLLTAARPAVAVAESATPIGQSRADSLPLPPTRLIGREAEVAALSELLAQSDTRLVTLMGAGGTGKTHLALTVAAAVRNRYPDGVCFVDLSLVTDPALVVPTILPALGVRERAGESLRESLNRSLRDRRLLLVLDNCEQVLGAAADVASLLAVCQDLEILATSREPLHIRAEQEMAVAPLPVPDPDRLPPLADLARIPAVALFVERARAASAGFTLTADNAAAVAAICRRLDGLLLAIELAADRVKVLPPQALLARLEQRLPLLTGGGRDLPTRQRTMRDAIAWSYELLDPTEQELFRRLAVFAGGFTPGAAEAVASPGGEPAAFDGVAALVEQSLLRHSPGMDDEPRYLMFETVREFGLEQLTLVGEMDDARGRHATHFLRLSESLAQHSWMPRSENLIRMLPERDNVRLALTWCNERGEFEALLRLCALGYGFWVILGLYREGLQWVERALDRSSHNASMSRGQALAAAGMMAAFQGDYARAAEFADAELALARELGDPTLVGQALMIAGFVSYRRGEYRRAEELMDDAYRRLRELADREPNAVLTFGTALLLLGDIALAQEQFDRAATWYVARLHAEEAREHYQTAWGPIDAQAGLAGVGYCTGDYRRAAALYVDSLDRARDLGITLLVASALLGLAGIAAESGQPEDGARLLGAAEGITESLGAPFFPRDQPIRKRALAAALGAEQLAAAQEAGRALSVEEAIAEAVAVAEAVRVAP